MALEGEEGDSERLESVPVNATVGESIPGEIVLGIGRELDHKDNQDVE
jgi:hypothetical protein